MTPEPWLYVLLFVVGTQLLTVAYAFRRGQSPESDAAATAAVGPSEGADGVLCPDCGARNEPEYRYCGHCVSALPGSVGAGRPLVSPLGGRSL